MRQPATFPFWSAGYPPGFPGLALWLDGSDLSTMLNNAGSIPAPSDGIKLWGDKSGNSGVNCLCLNGVAGNYASAPDSVPLSITGDIDIRVRVAANDWTPSADTSLLSKMDDSASRSFRLQLLTTGALQIQWSEDGTATITKTSTVTVGATDLTTLWVRVTLDVDNGATGNDVKFYTSTDGVTWTQLGATVTTAATTSIFNSVSRVEVGSTFIGTSQLLAGRVYRAQIRNNILDNGTGIQFDANFATASKLATSFPESSSNAATVTINTSGDTGARISGERDVVQMTAANQAIMSVDSAGRLLTFDGTNDYLKAAAFSLAQPCTVYFVGSQVTWTLNDEIYDGGGSDSMELEQSPTASPNIRMFSGAYGPALTTGAPALATNVVITAVFSGANSFLRRNRDVLATGNAGTASANGFTLGANAAGARFGNITARAVLIYAANHSQATQDAIILYLGRTYGIAV